ncbi:MAG: hypothetical protein COB85_06390, partial [Bacteroidetes bacterium]
MVRILTLYLLLLSVTGFSQSQNISGLLASTFVAGDDSEVITCMCTDDNGFVYVAGFTYSSDFPITLNTFASDGVVYICKFDPSLQNLIAATRLGANDGIIEEMTVYNNELIAIGHTSTSGFPVTPGAYDTIFGGTRDAFVLKMDLDLENLLASTYFGTGGSEAAWTYAIDGSGNIFIAGPTYSTNLPTSTGALDESYNANTDGYIAKFSNDLSTLMAATYLGGAEYDRIDEMTIDQEGNIIIAGSTESSDYPVTMNALHTAPLGGSNDIFISKINNNLTSLISSGFFGGNGQEQAMSLKIDQSGNVFLAGVTFSDTIPIKAALDSSYNGNSDILLAKFTSNLDTLLSSTYFGGSDQEG